MSIRAIGVAVAVVFAMACRTSGSQTREASGTAQAPSGDTHGASGTSTAQAPSSTTSSSDVSGSTASSAPGTSAGQDPLVEPGPPIKGHASDQVVSGKIEEVSDSSVTISSHAGDRKVLQIEAETDIMIDGMDASAADLEEGQPVRASYNQAEGEDVAVAIEAGKEPAGGEPKELGMTPGSATGGSAAAGSGAASEPASPTGSGSGGSASGTSSSSDVSGSTASSAPGTSAGQDPLVVPGPPIKGHASDQVVSGKIEEVSGSSVTISSHAGDRKVLQIEAETDIRIDGMDASAADLEEGQPVRASYNQAEGEDVAVEIEAGRESPGGEAKELGMPPGSATGGSAPGSSGSASEPAAPTGTGSGR